MENPPPVRAYRPKWGWRIFSFFFPIFGGCAVVSSLRDYVSQSEDFKPGVLIVGLLFMIIGTGMVVQGFTSHVRFTHDSIEHRTLFRRKSLPLSAIRGRREYTTRDSDGVPTHYLRLVPNSDRLPTLEFTKSYALDDAFFRWFYSLPELNERDEPISNFSIFSSR
jgi:hypothetical protein